MNLEELETLLNEDKIRILTLIERRFNNNKKLYNSDFYLLGAIKRNYGNINGIVTLIHSKNMNSARCLLRIHLDTLLRFHALWCVENTSEFSLKVFNGEQVNNFKDKSGKRLTDRHLVDLLSKNFPWVKNVYENLCSYVHFSNLHIMDGIDLEKPNTRLFKLEITNKDTKYPEESWKEILEWTHQINIIFHKYVENYLSSLSLED